MATVSNNSLVRTDLDPVTLRALNAFRRRRGVLLLLRALGVGLLVFVSLALLLATFDYLFFFSDGLRWILSLAIYAITTCSMWFCGVAPWRERDELAIARQMENAAPQLREDLVSAVELSDPDSNNGSAQFRRILQNRVARGIAKMDVGKVLPMRLVRRWLFSGMAVAIFCLSLMMIPSAQFGRRFARAALPGVSIERASRTKVTILEPTPATGYVAERDAVGVIARVIGAESDDVVLHWKSADGTQGESLMTPRLDPASFQPGHAGTVGREIIDDSGSGNSMPTGMRFAANLSVGSVPLQYRITAGDAITLWHELTPLPRPRVLRYEKLYRMPKYAQLDDRRADEEHGDLKALQGTTAEVTVTFDQPVEEPTLRFGVRGTRSTLEPVDESGTRFMASVSVKTSGQYQVDATSRRSGLNNPFAPTNMITPVLDTPPLARWDKSMKRKQMVSALDVVDLIAHVSDDLPLKQVLHQVQVNDEPFRSYALTLPEGERKAQLVWTWDMLHRLGDNSDTPKLSAGDLVRSRLLALDRNGERSESEILEFLIAGDGFNTDRHRYLEPLASQTRAIMDWADSSEALAKRLKEIGRSGTWEELQGLKTEWAGLQKQSVELIKSVSKTLSATQNPANASTTELVGRSILDVESRLDAQVERMAWLADRSEEQWKGELKRAREEVARDADQTGYQAERLSEFAQARFERALSASLYTDLLTLRTTVTRLVEQPPRTRLLRYLALVSGQLAEVDRMVEQYEPLLSQQYLQHLSGEMWLRWSQRWRIQLDKLQEDRPSRDSVQAVMESMALEIKDKPQHVVFSGIHNTALRWGTGLRREMSYLAELTRGLWDVGNRLTAAREKLKRQQGAKAAVADALQERWQELRWKTELKRLLVRAGGQESLNRAKSEVDLAYAADQQLFVRAIKNVTAEGYRPYQEQPADQVLTAIGGAIGVLQAASDLRAARQDFLSIAEGERQHSSSPLRKIYHPLWYSLQSARIELGVRNLQSRGVDWEPFLQRLDSVRYNEDHQQAFSRIDSRQWKLDPFVSAANPLALMSEDLRSGIAGLEARSEEARDVLRMYVLKISEQAREAAEAARQAKQETDQRVDSSDEVQETLETSQQDAVDKATETISSLIDRANTADVIDQTQREEARDADAAAELIAEAVKDTKQAINEAKRAATDGQRGEAEEKIESELQELSDQLERAAEHFEKLENGEDVTESRAELRLAEQELRDAAEIDQRYQDAEELAETATQDPRDLLERLERELRRNEPMQKELSDIASDVVEDAAQNLAQASRDEEDLQRRLEGGDRGFAEQKKQQQLMLQEFGNRAKTLKDRTLQTASKAAGWANDIESRKKIEEVREELSEALENADEVRSNDATLNEINQAREAMKRVLEKAAEATESIAGQFEEGSKENLHGEKQKRDAAAQNMFRESNQNRNEELRAIDQQRKAWGAAEKDAGRRVRAFEQQQRQADQSLRREQDRIKREPDNQGAKEQAKRQESRSREAERTAKQARATRELASQRQKKATDRANQINRKKSQKLEKPNPAAELGGQLARRAAASLRQLSSELGEMEQSGDIADELRSNPDNAEKLSGQQQTVEQNVQDAADDLSRAARHEERLENRSAAERLAEASEQTEQNAGQPAQQAGRDLQQAGEQADQAGKAAQSLADASDAIAEQGKQIEAMFSGDSAMEDSSASPGPAPASVDRSNQPEPTTGSADPMQSPGSPPSPAPAQPGEPSQSGMPSQAGPSGADPSEARQMARTLDELDRSLAAQNQGQPGQPGEQPGTTQDGQSPESQGQPGEGQSGEAQPGQGQSGMPQPGQGEPGGEEPNALQASPTLAEMLEAAMQQAARERMQSLQQAQASQGEGNQSSSDSSSSAPISESGQGEPPGGPEEVDLLGGELQDGDWGSLRDRGVDDAAQGRGTRIPPGYARELKAYFKALSKRAAETK